MNGNKSTTGLEGTMLSIKYTSRLMAGSRFSGIIASLCIVAALPALSHGADNDPESGQQQPIKVQQEELRTFIYAYASKGSPNRIGEYSVTDDGVYPGAAFAITGGDDTHFVEMSGEVKNSSEQDLTADVNIKEGLRVKIDYNRLPHKLEHDPIANVNEVPGNPPVRKLFTTDHDIGAEYELDRTVAKAEVTFSSLKLPGLSVHAGFRLENRKGHRQAKAFSMCQTCHVSSYGKRIGQVTQDYEVGFEYEGKRTTVRYSAIYRDFEERALAPQNHYEGPNTNPEPGFFETWNNQTPQNYSDKLTYLDETLPFSYVPDTHKWMHKLNSITRLGKASQLGVYGVLANHTNEHNEAEVSNLAAGAKWSTVFSRKLQVFVNYGYRDIDNDDIREAQINAMAPYQAPDDPYYNPDDVYHSALSRTEHKSNLDVRYSLGSKSDIRVGWEGRIIDRSHFMEDSTTENSVSLAYKTPISPRSDLSFKCDGTWTRNPFENRYGGLELPAGDEYLGMIYSEFYKHLRHPLTSEPDRTHGAEVSVNFVPNDRLTVSFSSNYKLEKNDAREWEWESVSPSLAVTYIREHQQLSLYYSYNKSRTKTYFSLADILLKGGELQYSNGSLSRQIPYDEEVHSVGLSYLVQASRKLSMGPSLTFVASRAEVDTSTFKGYPSGSSGEFIDMADFSDFSNHEYRQLQAGVNVNYRLSDKWMFEGQAGFLAFDNPIVYIVDEEGSSFYAHFGFAYRPSF